MFALQNKVRGLKIGVEVIDILFVQLGNLLSDLLCRLTISRKKSVFITD